MSYTEPRERVPKKNQPQPRKRWTVKHSFDVDGLSEQKWLANWHTSGKFATEEQVRQSIADSLKGQNHGYKFKRNYRGGYRLYNPAGLLVEEFYYER